MLPLMQYIDELEGAWCAGKKPHFADDWDLLGSDTWARGSRPAWWLLGFPWLSTTVIPQKPDILPRLAPKLRSPPRNWLARLTSYCRALQMMPLWKMYIWAKARFCATPSPARR